jgi:hypothetical protein
LLVTPYSLLEQVRLALQAHRGQVLEEEFGVDVTITARFPVQRWRPFQATLQELSNGTLEGIVVETNEATIMPLGDGGPRLM